MIYGTFIQSPYFWYLVSRRQKNLLFLVFNVLGATGTQMEKGKLHSWFSSGEQQREEELSEKSHEAQKMGAHAARFFGRMGPTIWSLRHLLARGFFSTTPYRRKNERPNSSKFIRGGGGGETPDPLRGGSDPTAPELRRGGKSPPSSSPLLLGVGGCLYIIITIKTSTMSITISAIHSVPLVV